MGIKVYSPTNLQTEIDKYVKANGNYSVDYRGVNTGSNDYYIDTPYTLSNSTTQSVKSLPMIMGEASGNTSTTRTMVLDNVIKNDGASDIRLNLYNTKNTLYTISYIRTISIKLGSVSKLLHYYLSDSNLITLVKAGAQVDPIIIVSASETSIGIKNNKRGMTLGYNLVPNLESVTVDPTGTRIILTQTTTDNYDNNAVVDSSKVDKDIINLNLVQSTNRKIDKNFKFITTLPADPILNIQCTNYSSYYATAYPGYTTPKGYSFMLRSGESVLVSTEITYKKEKTLDTPITDGSLLTNDTLLYNSFYTGDLSSVSNVIDITIPTTIPTVSTYIGGDDDNDGYPVTTNATFDVFVNNVKYQMTTTPTDLQSLADGFDSILGPLGIIVLIVNVNTNSIAFINTTSDSKDIICFYKNITMKTRRKLEVSSTLNADPNLLPDNDSLCYTTNMINQDKLYDSYDSYDCHAFNLSSGNFNACFTDNVSYNLTVSQYRTNLRNRVIINGTALSINLDSSIKDEDYIAAYCDYLNKSQSTLKVSFTATKITFKNITNKFVKVSFESLLGFNVDPSYDYLSGSLSSRKVVYLRGTNG